MQEKEHEEEMLYPRAVQLMSEKYKRAQKKMNKLKQDIKQA